MRATNSTRARRRAIVERTANRFAGTGRRCGIIFLETICDDARVLEMNMRTKGRGSPDFAGLSEDEALEDLRARVRNYEAVYETVREDEGAFIKLYNFSSKVECASIYGRMSKTVLPFLLAIHVDDRPIYLVALAPRKGEPEYGGEDVRVTHDDELRDRLAAWCEATAAPPTAVFASTVRGAVIAANKLKRPGRSVRFTSALAPLLVPYASAAGDGSSSRSSASVSPGFALSRAACASSAAWWRWSGSSSGLNAATARIRTSRSSASPVRSLWKHDSPYSRPWRKYTKSAGDSCMPLAIAENSDDSASSDGGKHHSTTLPSRGSK